ncbi:uncharacterized protein LOC127724415 [Mytilus californianus]|uniref:uncharacterized protein LOC127724415 n=1 Tax=Mytilus californianus TaxID=6549 RepID=UPI002246BE19|nr:uncharacterized protein LOC127724415 [Mytilus californianus]
MVFEVLVVYHSSNDFFDYDDGNSFYHLKQKIDKTFPNANIECNSIRDVYDVGGPFRSYEWLTVTIGKRKYCTEVNWRSNTFCDQIIKEIRDGLEEAKDRDGWWYWLKNNLL